MSQFMRSKDYTPTSIIGSEDLLASIEKANKSWMGPIPPSNVPDKANDLSSNVKQLLGVK